MTRVRVLVGGLGVLVGSYGAWLLLTRQDTDALISAVIWLGAGVVLHDFVLAPLVLLLLYVGARVLPARVRRVATVGVVVLGTATLFAIPVLGRFGARPDNPTLLDRNYVLGWLVLAGLTLLCVVVAALVGSRRR